MLNSPAHRSGAEAANQPGRSLTAGYAVKRLSASLSPRDRRESGRAVPRGAHRARSALSASTRESTVAGRAARETLERSGRNGEAPSDRSLGASVYRPSPLVGDERRMAPKIELLQTKVRLRLRGSDVNPNVLIFRQIPPPFFRSWDSNPEICCPASPKTGAQNHQRGSVTRPRNITVSVRRSISRKRKG